MKTYYSELAPKAIGPYAQAVRTGNLLYCSGQTPLDPATMKLEGSNAGDQTRRALKNLEVILSAAGLSLTSVVKTNVFLTTMDDFAEMNDVYAKIFGDHRPARSTVAVAGLPLRALVEIECIAEFKDSE